MRKLKIALLCTMFAALIVGIILNLYEPQPQHFDTKLWVTKYYSPVASRSTLYQSPLFENWAGKVKDKLAQSFPNLTPNPDLDVLAQAYALELSTKSTITINDLGIDAAYQRLTAVGPPNKNCWAWYSYSLVDTEKILGIDFRTATCDAIWNSYYSERTSNFGIGVYYDPHSAHGVIWTVLLADPSWKITNEKLPVNSEASSSEELFAGIDRWRNINYDAVNPVGIHRVFQSSEAMSKADEMYRLINKARRDKGLHPLERVPQLERLAQAQAIYLADNDDYTHINKEGLNPYDRLLGIDPPLNCYVQENAYVVEDDVKQAMNEFMKSITHKENILRTQHTMVGIGYYYDPESQYKHYWVQLFSDSAEPFESLQN